MANCIQILKGTTVDCQPSLGGVRKVYIANFADVTSVEVKDDMITAINLTGGAKFHEYSFRKGQANFTSTLNVADNGGTSVSTDLVMNFDRMETAKRVEMSALAVGELIIIVVDGNGAGWLLGKDFPVTSTAGTGETGSNFTDSNQYSITLQDTSMTWPFEIKLSAGTTGDSAYVDLDELVEPA